MIRGLSWPALLSLAVQKGTNWQWANESSLSPSGAQLPPLHSWPSFLFTFVVFPLLYLSPLPPLFFLLHISFLDDFLLFLPRIERCCPASASSSVDCGLAEPNAAHESRSHHTDHLHIPIRSCFLILTIRNGAGAPSLRSFCLTRRGRREITSGERERRLEYQMWE